jgi:Protein of unknown function (DUF3592)
MTPMTWSGRPGKWLTITAIIEIVLAGVFLVVGLMNPILRFGFVLTAAILGGVAILLLLWGRKWQKGYAEAQRIKAQGVPGQATIMSMRQTGVYVNEQPQIELQLQVQDEMYGSRQVTMKEYVPLMLLGTLSSGRPLPVKVDPANPNNVVIEWESAMSGGMPMGGVPGAGQFAMGQMQPMPTPPPPLPKAEADREKKRILADGIGGTARILASSPTGQMDDQGRPIHQMTLQIEILGRQPVMGPALAGVPAERADQLEVGDSVPVKADPNNPSSIAIDWDNA